MPEQHPIQGLMYTAMQSLKEMIDVNTIVGDAVQTPDGTVIIPISKVGLGFAVGGSDYAGKSTNKENSQAPMFGGGSGGGVFLYLDTGQQEAEVAGEQQEAFGVRQLARRAVGAELIEGVEGLKLDARVRKKRGEGHGLMKGFDGGCSAPVAVAEDLADALVVLVKQGIIHAPSVDADVVGGFACLAGCLQAVQDLFCEVINVPNQMTVLFLCAVGEAVDLFFFYFAVSDASDDMTSRGGTDVDRQIGCHGVISFIS